MASQRSCFEAANFIILLIWDVVCRRHMPSCCVLMIIPDLVTPPIPIYTIRQTTIFNLVVLTQFEQRYWNLPSFPPIKIPREKQINIPKLKSFENQPPRVCCPNSARSSRVLPIGMACKLRRGLVPAPSTSNAPESCERIQINHIASGGWI